MDDMKEGSGHASKSVDETARQKLLDLERKAKRRKVKQIRVQKIKAAMRYQVFERMWKLMLLDSNKVQFRHGRQMFDYMNYWFSIRGQKLPKCDTCGNAYCFYCGQK